MVRDVGAVVIPAGVPAVKKKMREVKLGKGVLRNLLFAQQSNFYVTRRHFI